MNAPTAAQSTLDLISYATEDVHFIGATSELSPVARAALDRIRLALHELDLIATAQFVSEAPPCRD